MDLSITVNGIKFPNPFLLGSGPPGTNARVLAKSYDAGWGGAVAKTVSLESSKVVNVVPRYGKLRSRNDGEVIGFENIELISDRPIEVWLEEFRHLKKDYPDHVLIASIMEEYSRDAWIEIVQRCEAAGVDSFELNFSCAHGLPERKMGAAMGQDCAIMEEVCRWVVGASKIPVWAKLTPNVTDVASFAREPRVHVEIQRAVDDANSKVSNVEAIKRFTILPTEWTVDSEELTPTLKLKRRVIHEKYSEEIDSLYA